MTNLTERQGAILRLLAEYKALTGKQIWRALNSDQKDQTAVLHQLARLRTQGLVRGEPLEPEKGAASVLVWALLKPGADRIGVPHGSHYYRRPRPGEVYHRGLLLELERQVATAGWQCIKPRPYGPLHPLPEITPQAQQLIRAVYDWEGATLAAESHADPTSANWQRLGDYNNRRLATHFPRQVNDYVAYRPGYPAHTVVLIPQPPYATRQFWNRPRPPRPTEGRPGRAILYAPVAQWFYCIGVCDDEALADELKGIVGHGLRILLTSQVGTALTNIATGKAQTPPQRPAGKA